MSQFSLSTKPIFYITKHGNLTFPWQKEGHTEQHLINKCNWKRWMISSELNDYISKLTNW